MSIKNCPVGVCQDSINFTRSALELVEDTDLNGRRIVTLCLHSDMDFDYIVSLFQQENKKPGLLALAEMGEVVVAHTFRDKEAVLFSTDSLPNRGDEAPIQR